MKWLHHRRIRGINDGLSQLNSVECNALLPVLLRVYLICALTCKSSVKWLILAARACMCVFVHVHAGDFEPHCVVTIIKANLLGISPPL